MDAGRAALLCLVLTGCAVAEYPYPAANWDPLDVQPDSDCREFAGRYTDRGERPNGPEVVSFTRELFGASSDWENASAVELAIPKAGVVQVGVFGPKGKLFSRTLEGKDAACRGGQLILRDHHWIGGYIMTGRQHIEVELNQAGPRIVTQVEELAYGAMFIIFPVVGTARHWYRFERLAN